MLAIAVALAAPLNLNADLVDPAGNDATCLKGPSRPKGPASFTIPIGKAAETLVFRWVAAGPAESGANAALIEVHWEDGTELKTQARLGQQVQVAMNPAPDTLPELVGTKGGKPVIGTRWALRTGRPDAVVNDVQVTSRSSEHDVCLLSVEPAALSGAAAERTDTRDWYPFLVGPTLEKPVSLPVEPEAGKRGFVKVDPDGHLRFEDGTRARFWGVNLYQTNAIPAKEDADAYAATLAALGFNLVRAHHIDMPLVGLVDPKRGEPGHATLDPAMADRLDYFLSRCKAHGIYLFLEVATARTFTAQDGVRDPTGVTAGHKLVPMWEDDWRDAYLKWFEDLWGRTNPHTGLRYADDPMVAIVELANEHSLLASWGGPLEGLPTVHLARLDERWNAWLKARYGDEAKLRAAWAGGVRGGLVSGEVWGAIRREPVASSFSGVWPEARQRDLLAFYAELERGFYDAVSAKSKALGFKVPTVPTLSYGRADLQAMHAAWPVADLHYEWDHIRGSEIRNRSALASPWDQDLFGAAAWAVAGRAFTASEFNHPGPGRYIAEAPLLWATMASVQDWDALIWFSMQTSRDGPQATWLWDQFDLRAGTVKLAQSPTASALFRGGWVEPAPGYWPLAWSKSAVEFFAANGRAALDPDLSDPTWWLGHRVRSVFTETPPVPVAGTPTPGVGWWTDPGVMVLDRPQIQARIGPPAAVLRGGGGVREPARLRVALEGWAAVSLASMDGTPLDKAKKALLVVATRQENTGQEWAWNGHYLRTTGAAPVLVEPAKGVVAFAWPRRPKVRMLGSDMAPGAELPVTAGEKGWWSVKLDATVRSPMMLVE